MANEFCKTKEDVLKIVREKDVSFIQFWFTDVLGMLKSFAITPSELETGMIEGMGFDGSSIEGFARIEESDMVALPDPSTFRLLPWRPEERPVARMFCDVVNPDHTPYEGDPRYVLKRLLKTIADKGYTFFIGPELEYFYFKNIEEPVGLDNGGYFDSPPLDLAANLRRDTIFSLQSMGIDVEYSHHEVAPSQHEIDLRYDEALSMSDKTMTYRIVVKEIARRHGYYATFMPKPIFGENGSGMHVHQSLFKGDKNLFFDGNEPYHLSKIAKGYIAGIMRHSREIIAVTNQWVNSYKRLVPGYEAPVNVAWSEKNRSPMVRVPARRGIGTRCEVRVPDPSCNPYLAFAAMLASGLDGIERELDCGEPVNRNIFNMSQREKKRLKIVQLPASLYDALDFMEKDKMLRGALGDHIFDHFLYNKRTEWSEYIKEIHDWELERYLDRY